MLVVCGMTEIAVDTDMRISLVNHDLIVDVRGGPMDDKVGVGCIGVMFTLQCRRVVRGLVFWD